MAINKKLKAQVDAAMGNPFVQSYLNMLSGAEGTEKYGYQQGFGTNNRIASLEDHPREFHSFTTKGGKRQRTSAAGRYQFLSNTWDDMSDRLGLSDFGPESQDRAAIGLIAQAGGLDALMKGDINTTLQKTGKIWASLPTAPKAYDQPTRDMAFIQRYFGEDLRTPTALAQQTPQGQGDANPSNVAGLSADRAGNVASTEPRSAFDMSAFVNNTADQNLAQLSAADEMDVQDTTPDWAQDFLNMEQGQDPNAVAAQQQSIGQSLIDSPYRDDIIDAEADQARSQAMNSMFGAQPAPSSVSVPVQIDRSIRRFIEEITT